MKEVPFRLLRANSMLLWDKAKVTKIVGEQRCKNY